MGQMKTYYYSTGSAANKVEELTPEIKRRELRKKKKQKRQIQAKQKQLKREARLSVLYLTGVIILFSLFLISGIYLQTSIISNMNHIASMENEISTIKASNAARINRINGSTNLSQIKDIARNQLGMTEPNPDQIIYYHVVSSDYMTQYSNIPN